MTTGYVSSDALSLTFTFLLHYGREEDSLGLLCGQYASPPALQLFADGHHLSRCMLPLARAYQPKCKREELFGVMADVTSDQ